MAAAGCCCHISFLVPGYVVVAVVSAVSEGMLAVQHTVLKRYHYLVKLTEERHQLPHAEFIGIRADRAAGDAVVARALVGLADKVDLEGGGVLRLFFGRVPLDVFDDALLFSALPLSVLRSVRAKYHLM